MAESVIHTSFAAGEISPNLFARVDLDKYHVGAQLMRNFFVDYRGGASTRPGTELIDRTRFASRKARLISFIFSQQQSYVLEIGNQYIRFYNQGQQLLEAGKVIIGVTQANPAVVNVAGHGYSTGDDVFISGALGMTALNFLTYAVTVIDANHFSLQDLDGNNINSSAFPAYTGGGLSARVYTLASPWLEAELPLLKFVQSADVMTLTHPNYGPYNLSRTSPSTFSLAAITFGSKLAAPAGLTAVPTTAGNLAYGYVVVAADDNGDLSLPSANAVANSEALDPVNAAPKVVALNWGAVTGATHYHVYKWGPVFNTQPAPTFYGFIGQTTTTSFTDINIAPDFSNGPPEFRNPFSGGSNPGCVTYFQQRRTYGGLSLSPEEIDMSRTGTYDNFDVSATVNDSDAIQIAIAARQVNEIKSMVPMSSGLVVLTTGGAFQITGGAAQTAVTPTNVTALPQASSGANDLPPIVVNYDILFVQNKGSIVRDLAYNFYLQTFYGFDRSALANHLFFGRTLLEWAWAEEPFKIVWATRDDGRLLSLTYVPEQEVYGWARHDTQGVFESVCTVPEGQEDAVYFIVERALANNARVRYIERMASRKFIRIEDAWCVDCGLSRVLTRPNYALDMSANTMQAFIQAVTGAPFDATWIGRIIWFDIGGKLRVNTVSSANQIVCDILEPLGNAIPNTANPIELFRIESGAWEEGTEVSTLGGLQHLQGLQVAVLADGESVGPLTVPSTGTITLPNSMVASKVLVGLGFQAQLETLYLDVGDPTIQGKRKMIAAVTARVDQSRGLAYGQDFEHLTLMKESSGAVLSQPIPLQSKDQRIIINGTWNTGGVICVQQDFPFPSTVLGLIPEVTFGDTQK